MTMCDTRPVTKWWHQAACAGLPTSLFFPKRGVTNITRQQRICAQCPVQLECLTEALNTAEVDDFGVRAGTHRVTRTKLRRRGVTAEQYLEGSRSFAGRVSGARAATGLSQINFGALIGVSGPTIGAWESGRVKPNNRAAIEQKLDQLGVQSE